MQLIVEKVFKTADEAAKLLNDSMAWSGHKVITISPLEQGGVQVHIKAEMKTLVEKGHIHALV